MGTIQIITLAISGLLLLMVGTLRISNPIKNYLKNSGIKLDNDVDLLNELRGTSGVMLLGGITILLGILITKLTITSFVVAILIFAGFAVGRILSFSFDGKPNKQIIQGLVSELILSAVNIFCLINILA